MSMKDFNKYLFQVSDQVSAAKADLAEFETYLKQGYFTEDRFQEIKDEYWQMESNLDRLLYCAYLLALPTRTKKQASFKKANKKVESYLENANVTDQDIINENKCALDIIREKLNTLKAEVDGK